LEKKDIALIQLETACKLYSKGNFVCAITLAGASEEIFGKIAKERTGINQIEDELNYLKNSYKSSNKEVPNDKELISRINKGKNSLKHNNSGVNKWIDIDFESEAVFLIVKAVKNYFRSYNKMPDSKIINDIFDHLTL